MNQPPHTPSEILVRIKIKKTTNFLHWIDPHSPPRLQHYSMISEGTGSTPPQSSPHLPDILVYMTVLSRGYLDLVAYKSSKEYIFCSFTNLSPKLPIGLGLGVLHYTTHRTVYNKICPASSSCQNPALIF